MYLAAVVGLEATAASKSKCFLFMDDVRYSSHFLR